MRIVFLVEGRSDFYILGRLAEMIAGKTVDAIAHLSRFGGYGEVLRRVDRCVWHAYHQGAKAAVLHVDADNSPAHERHATGTKPTCRHCTIIGQIPTVPSPRPAVCVAVPVQAIEAWLLQWSTKLGIKHPGDPRRTDRHRAKMLLWGSTSPRFEHVKAVTDELLGKVGVHDLDTLAERQPSFECFRSSIRGAA